MPAARFNTSLEQGRPVLRLLFWAFSIGSPSQLVYAQTLGKPIAGDPVVPHVFKGDLRTVHPAPITPQSATREAPIGDGIPLRPEVVLPIPEPKGLPDELFLPGEAGPVGAVGVTPREFSTPN